MNNERSKHPVRAFSDPARYRFQKQRMADWDQVSRQSEVLRWSSGRIKFVFGGWYWFL